MSNEGNKSLEHITAVVESFISDTHNELLVIKGTWGAGKTFFWQKLIEECKRRRCIGRAYYSYVSLFGINGLEELKNAILVSTVESNATKSKQKIDTLATNLKNLTTSLEKIPKLSAYTGGMVSAFLHSLLDNTLVCFDDIERRGDELAIKDIFGLASVLKEQRGCKVLLIVNDERLGEAQEQFKLHGEKIIDREILFLITAEEAFDYVFQPTLPYYTLIKECCLTLGVTNIRTLQRIGRFIEDITPHLRGIEKEVAEGALSSLILFVWSYYEQANGAPSPDYILAYSPVTEYLASQSKKELSPEEKKWNAVLSLYNYFYAGEIDKYISEFVNTGYIDKPKLSRELDKENKQFLMQQGQDSIPKAWDIYLDSFDNNEQEFIETLVSNSRAHIKNMSLSELQGVVSALREFERDTAANALVDEYFIQRNAEEDMNYFRRLKGTVFEDEINDEYLRNRVNHILTSDEIDKRSLEEVVKTLFSQAGWNEDDIRRLDSFSSEDYYSFFKAERSAQLRSYVRKCLDFGKLDHEHGIYKSISGKAKEALLKIASESKINRMRVSKLYKVEGT